MRLQPDVRDSQAKAYWEEIWEESMLRGLHRRIIRPLPAGCYMITTDLFRHMWE
jgi:hypothetical protein